MMSSYNPAYHNLSQRLVSPTSKYLSSLKWMLRTYYVHCIGFVEFLLIVFKLQFLSIFNRWYVFLKHVPWTPWGKLNVSHKQNNQHNKLNKRCQQCLQNYFVLLGWWVLVWATNLQPQCVFHISDKFYLPNIRFQMYLFGPFKFM